MTFAPYKLLDLFSGIGGFSLGLERSGAFETVAFCEIEPFPRKVLAKHWLKVPCYDDIRTLTAARLAADGIAVDAICGGFPCQDISTAGQGRGLDGARSGLWFEYARLIGELRPKYVIVENVAALLGRGLEQVLGSLASIGYDAEWHCISAAAIGAKHKRDRLWIVVYPRHEGVLQSRLNDDAYEESSLAGGVGLNGISWWQKRKNVADAMCAGLEGQRNVTSRIAAELNNIGNDSWWAVEPDVGRVAHGISDRAHRLKGLGNAVVPQIPELIGRAIAAAEVAA